MEWTSLSCAVPELCGRSQALAQPTHKSSDGHQHAAIALASLQRGLLYRNFAEGQHCLRAAWAGITARCGADDTARKQRNQARGSVLEHGQPRSAAAEEVAPSATAPYERKRTYSPNVAVVARACPFGAAIVPYVSRRARRRRRYTGFRRAPSLLFCSRPAAARWCCLNLAQVLLFGDYGNSALVLALFKAKAALQASPRLAAWCRPRASC